MIAFLASILVLPTQKNPPLDQILPLWIYSSKIENKNNREGTSLKESPDQISLEESPDGVSLNQNIQNRISLKLKNKAALKENQEGISLNEPIKTISPQSTKLTRRGCDQTHCSKKKAFSEGIGPHEYAMNLNTSTRDPEPVMYTEL